MISIIIPAYNEEKVIGRCLSAIIDGYEPDEVEIIVACNGCVDRTPEIARTFGKSIKVLDIEKASKTNALNVADREARFFPRIYIDADVVISYDSIKKIVKTLSKEVCLLASPIANNNLDKSDFLVKSFYRVWHNLPYNKVMVGTGVYALSDKGRSRFKEFPDIIADDAYVRFLFTPEERCAVDGAGVEVFAPQTVRDLIHVKTRSRLGYSQLRKNHINDDVEDARGLKTLLSSLNCRIGLIWDIPVYIIINLIVRANANNLHKKQEKYTWARDVSTR